MYIFKGVQNISIFSRSVLVYFFTSLPVGMGCKPPKYALPVIAADALGGDWALLIVLSAVNVGTLVCRGLNGHHR